MHRFFRTGFLREITGYTLATVVAFVIDFSLYAVQVSLLHVPYLVAAAISFVVGTIVVYVLVTRHVFAFRRVEDYRKEFGVFLTVGAIGLGANLLLIYLFVDKLGVHFLIAKIGAGAVTFFANFAVRRMLLFTPWSARRSQR